MHSIVYCCTSNIDAVHLTKIRKNVASQEQRRHFSVPLPHVKGTGSCARCSKSIGRANETAMMRHVQIEAYQ
jgi:hypothetical protein